MTILNFLPRGSTIKNSKEVIALVVYTGNDCKAMMDHGEDSRKLSMIFTLTFNYVGTLFGALIIILAGISYAVSRKISYWYIP